MARVKNNKRKNSITAAFKRTAIRHFELSGNKSLTCRELKIHRSNLALWIKNREIIMDPQVFLLVQELLKFYSLKLYFNF